VFVGRNAGFIPSWSCSPWHSSARQMLPSGLVNILTVNAGSSSVRLALYRRDRDRIELRARRHFDERSPSTLATFLSEIDRESIVAVSHRIVHGGSHLNAPCEIDARVEAEIVRLGRLAPLHNPIAAEWIATCRRAVPKAVGVAVFDTAFFARLPQRASTYALPRIVSLRYGFKRYGFHGIAHQALWEAWQKQSGRLGHGKLISFQLGSGCSVAAIKNGRPIDTSMGFTPLEGLVMSSRSGDLDPGLLLYLQKEDGLPQSQLQAVLEEQSGLLGLSGESGHVRDLVTSNSATAKLAIDVYCYRARKYLGAYLAALDGADAVAFGGGVGEHESLIRSRILEGFHFCGLEVDEAANRSAYAPMRISTPVSCIEAWVLRVNEEEALANAAYQLTKEKR
jgi:acetate kinase